MNVIIYYINFKSFVLVYNQQQAELEKNQENGQSDNESVQSIDKFLENAKDSVPKISKKKKTQQNEEKPKLNKKKNQKNKSENKPVEKEKNEIPDITQKDEKIENLSKKSKKIKKKEKKLQQQTKK